MNKEEIDKWLDNEYGVSYTRLEELHDFVVEQDLKHREEKDKEIDRLNNTLEMLEEENKILKGTISKALEFINNHTYRWKDTQFGEMVEVEDFEPGLKPIELINILKNKFENK